MQQLSPQAIARLGASIKGRLSQRAAMVAEAALRRVEARQGVNPVQTVVDGRRGVPVNQVRPAGRITYLIDPTPRIVADARSVLRAIAPVDTWPTHDERVFRDSFVTLVDGQQGSVAAMRAGEEVMVLSRLFGYSRRLERGWSIQAPNGVMEVAAAILKAKWGRVADIRFTYAEVRGFVPDRRDKPRGRYPVIVIRAKGIA